MNSEIENVIGSEFERLEKRKEELTGELLGIEKELSAIKAYRTAKSNAKRGRKKKVVEAVKPVLQLGSVRSIKEKSMDWWRLFMTKGKS